MENENDSQQEQQPLLSQTSVPSRSSRLASLDLLRGLVMIFESIDHARALISNIKVKHETWFEMPLYNGNVLHWFIRFITGICAPAFFFLMAIGIVLFNTSRQKIGWSQVRIVKHFATRGVLIVLINFLQFPLLTGKFIAIATVLYALGINIFVGSVIASMEFYSTKHITKILMEKCHYSLEEAEKRAVYISISMYMIFSFAITITTTEVTNATPLPISQPANPFAGTVWDILQETFSVGQVHNNL